MIFSINLKGTKSNHKSINAASSGICKELAILYCVSGYLVPDEDYNLRTIPDIMQRFGLVAY